MGVRVTTSRDDGRTFAVIAMEPVLTIGSPAAEGPAQFSNIRDIIVDGDGRVWVADGASRQVRIFGVEGNHLKSVGASGDGPGEFQRVRLLGFDDEENVVVWDEAIRRLTIFDSSGELVRTVPAPSDEDIVPQFQRMFGDGSILAQKIETLDFGEVSLGQVLQNAASLWRIDLDADQRSQIVSLEGPKLMFNGRLQVPIPFTTGTAYDVRGVELHAAHGSEFLIDIYSRDGLRERYGVSRSPRRVTAEEEGIYRQFYESAISDPSIARPYVDVIGHETQPEYMPAYYQIIVADDGNVWAQMYWPDLLAPATWDVYSSEGEWLGQVETPARFIVETIAGGKVWGIWRDDFGVEHVRAYRFTAN
jgi:hypothetical protein